MRIGELFHASLDYRLASVPRLEFVCEIFPLLGHDAAVGVGKLLRHSVACVAGEPEMGIVSLNGSDHLRGRNGNGVSFQVFCGPGVVSRSVGHDDLCLLQGVDSSGLRFERVGVLCCGGQNRGDFDVHAADLLRQSPPLVDRRHHVDRGGLLLWCVGCRWLIGLRRSAKAGSGAQHSAQCDSRGKDAEKWTLVRAHVDCLPLGSSVVSVASISYSTCATYD